MLQVGKNIVLTASVRRAVQLQCSGAVVRNVSSSGVVHASAAAQSSSDQPKPNRSFVMNLFSGKLQTAELFPYPEPLNEEQREYVQAFIDPTVKFYTVR